MSACCDFCNKLGCLSMKSILHMRIEITVALALSTALHAGIIFFAPGVRDTRGSARFDSPRPPVITAQLKNTLDAGKASRSRSLQSARAAHSAGINLASIPVRRTVRITDAARKEKRIDNVMRFYPPEAVRQGIEGETIVMLRIGGNGDVLAAQIAKSSGHVILDEAALRAIRATPRFAPGPREILLPVTFALQ